MVKPNCYTQSKYTKYTVATFGILALLLLAGTAYAIAFPKVTNENNEVPVVPDDPTYVSQLRLVGTNHEALTPGQMYVAAGSPTIKPTHVVYDSVATYVVEKTMVGSAFLEVKTDGEIKIKITPTVTNGTEWMTFSIELKDGPDSLSPNEDGLYTLSASPNAKYYSIALYVDGVELKNPPQTPPSTFTYSLTVEQV